MKNLDKKNLIRKIGAILLLIGALSIFPENDTWLHTLLQITFVLGCILFLLGNRLVKKSKNTALGLVIVSFTALSGGLMAQDYSKQVKAFEKSFNQKDVTVVQPFISDSLKFDPVPAQNTLPVLTNIVTNLPKLNSLQIQNSEKGKAYVKYDFEQLGISESNIHFDQNGKITRIEFVENLVQQEIEQQRKMRSSVQAPQLNKIGFDYSKKTVEFPSKDGLIISADLYEVDTNKPVILLCHQAGYNKYEYADIAPRLNLMGFNVLAIDQRSGGSFAGQPNETQKRALQKGNNEITFIDAIQDIESAINYLSDQYGQKVIIWGSSYSSALALHIAEKNDKVKAVISFSPGDYFGDHLPSLQTVFPKIEQPFLVTSSKEEADALKALISDHKLDSKHIQFIPEAEGFHGSRAVWIGQKGAEEYWTAIKAFLDKID